jgi:hypothetical protein
MNLDVDFCNSNEDDEDDEDDEEHNEELEVGDESFEFKFGFILLLL